MNAHVQFASQLFDRLWSVYGEQVPYAREYEKLVCDLGGKFVNDHVAFRTLRTREPKLGIDSIARVFLALGYEPREPLDFPATRLHALSYRHPSDALPKVFVSELLIDELDPPSRILLAEFAVGAQDRLDDEAVRELAACGELNEDEYAELLDRVTDCFTNLPWRSAPTEEEVRAVDAQSQYGAWVMLFGNNVNHFTALVNAHGVSELGDIEKVVQAMRARGIPMKAEIEGAPGSRLRQTATRAASVKVPLRSGAVEWPYAYFEVAERGEDPDRPGTLFQGFLGPQAQQLFEMTRRG